jgi:hypothetical protein
MKTDAQSDPTMNPARLKRLIAGLQEGMLYDQTSGPKFQASRECQN